MVLYIDPTKENKYIKYSINIVLWGVLAYPVSSHLSIMKASKQKLNFSLLCDAADSFMARLFLTAVLPHSILSMLTNTTAPHVSVTKAVHKNNLI